MVIEEPIVVSKILLISWRMLGDTVDLCVCEFTSPNNDDYLTMMLLLSTMACVSDDDESRNDDEMMI